MHAARRRRQRARRHKWQHVVMIADRLQSTHQLEAQQRRPSTWTVAHIFQFFCRLQIPLVHTVLHPEAARTPASQRVAFHAEGLRGVQQQFNRSDSAAAKASGHLLTGCTARE